MSAAATEVHVTRFDTVMGPVTLASSERGVVACTLPGTPDAKQFAWLAKKLPGATFVEGKGRNAAAVSAVKRFLEGKRQDLDLPLDMHGTAFQHEVWSALCEIPYGRTTTYAALAERIGRPTAVRAVGAANGANPLPLFVPCHRVIASDGSLCGFGGGLPLKRRLLELEGAEVVSGSGPLFAP